ncbi:hypothetical protein [Thermus sp. LT1-2-5]|uniref:hypothetical protein n=1 Tax=Thermus sp. LT1-2-5 TaxID=3026935 RepID=UPI00336580D8
MDDLGEYLPPQEAEKERERLFALLERLVNWDHVKDPKAALDPKRASSPRRSTRSPKASPAPWAKPHPPPPPTASRSKPS